MQGQKRGRQAKQKDPTETNWKKDAGKMKKERQTAVGQNEEDGESREHGLS